MSSKRPRSGGAESQLDDRTHEHTSAHSMQHDQEQGHGPEQQEAGGRVSGNAAPHAHAHCAEAAEPQAEGEESSSWLHGVVVS